MTPQKTEYLQVRVDPELKKRAKQLADKDGRTLSNWITLLIQREVDRAKPPK